MRGRLRRALFVLAIGALPVLCADNSLGTWKVDMTKSRYAPGAMPIKSYTMVREAAPGGVKVTITGERSDGTPINASYTAKFDGSPVAVSGSGTPYNSIMVKQVNANAFTYEGTNAGNKYHSTFRLVVGRDGKSMTSTGKGTDADGKPMTLTLVFEKQ